MNICVLDGYTLNPGDLSWDALKLLGDVAIYDRTTPEDVVSRAINADVILTNKVELRAATFSRLPNLKFVCVLATGYNVVDCVAARQLGIIVANIPAYSAMSVAQMVFAHLLNITHHVADYAKATTEGEWSRCKDFCYWDKPLIELDKKTIGIVGLGNTGMATARIALSFGMKVLALTSKSQEDLPEGITATPLERLLAESDAISLHCPLTESTRNLICKSTITRMKAGAILINTGRGPLINESDVAEALNCGHLAAFGADVLSVEPASSDNPLLTARNCFITPHIAWATFEARTRLMKIAVENVRQFINGEIIKNRVN